MPQAIEIWHHFSSSSSLLQALEWRLGQRPKTVPPPAIRESADLFQNRPAFHHRPAPRIINLRGKFRPPRSQVSTRKIVVRGARLRFAYAGWPNDHDTLPSLVAFTSLGRHRTWFMDCPTSCYIRREFFSVFNSNATQPTMPLSRYPAKTRALIASG